MRPFIFRSLRSPSQSARTHRCIQRAPCCSNDFKQRGHLTVTPTPRALPATREPQSPLQQPGRQPHAAAAHARNPSAPAAPGRPDPAAPHPLATADLPDGGAAVATSSHSNSDGDPDDAPPTASPLSAYDEVAIRAFHARGLLDFLIVGDVTRLEELRAVRVFLGSIGAGETKLLVKLKVRARAPSSSGARFVCGFHALSAVMW